MTDDEREQPRPPGYGEAESFEALYEAYGVRVYRFCCHLCGGNAADAEDLAQETFLAALQSLHRFEGRSSLATWLYRIALYRRQKRDARRRPETVPLREDLDAALVPDLADASLARISLERALAGLPDALRETFLLVKVEGLKLREAAGVLGIPLGTVKSRLHEAAARLQAALRAEVLQDALPAVEPSRAEAVAGCALRKEAGDEV